MKFLYSDTQDYVDPEYDFINDRNAPNRKRYWDDRYAHELLGFAPYDGLLVAMSGVRQTTGLSTAKGRYSLAEEQRFLRDGVRKFLRFGGPQFKDKMMMGDCGAFAYAGLDRPPYSPDQVVEFYAEAGFTHGCSPDHIIFDFDRTDPPDDGVDGSVRSRFEITLANAREFLRLTSRAGAPFVPIGVIQGWSPASMALAAAELESMGYSYLAVGGLVPLRPADIHQCLKAIRGRIKPETRLHLLGFAKAEQIHEFTCYGVESFDSTSPLIRAFKDAKANYYMASPGLGLEYYSAIRIPQALENPRLMRGVKTGQFKAEELVALEFNALSAVRGFDKGTVGFDEAVDKLSQYETLLNRGVSDTREQQTRELDKSRERIARTLRDAPWRRCECPICQTIGVEVVIFRSSNRNKRRGFHNLAVFHQHVKRTLGAA